MLEFHSTVVIRRQGLSSHSAQSIAFLSLGCCAVPALPDIGPGVTDRLVSSARLDIYDASSSAPAGYGGRPKEAAAAAAAA